jgi:NAD(P)-dependent dehydrogenase (short-subunit alcohol dehydrogenase family)
MSEVKTSLPSLPAADRARAMVTALRHRATERLGAFGRAVRTVNVSAWFRTTGAAAVDSLANVDAMEKARKIIRDVSESTLADLATACAWVLVLAALARSACGGSFSTNAFIAAASRATARNIKCVSEHAVFGFIDRYFALLAKNLTAASESLTGASRANTRAVVDNLAVFFASGSAGVEIKAVVLTVVFSMVASAARRGWKVTVGMYRDRERAEEVRVVLVTGGGGGLGSLILEQCRSAFPNATVYGTSRSGYTSVSSGVGGFFGLVRTPSKRTLDADENTPIGAERDENGQVTSHPLLAMDLTSEESIRECISTIVERHGKIDVLVNNAGICLASWANNTPREDAETIMQTNFLGVISVIREAMPHMRKGGNIINIGSIAGRIGIPYQSLYSASKAALMVYTDALRMEVKTTGIRVSLVEPGDLQPGMKNVIKSDGFDLNPVAVRAEKIMREEEAAGTDPMKVAKKVVKAIKSKKPKHRYLIGPDSWLVETLSRVCSYSAREYFLASHYRVPPGDKAWIRV